MACDACRDQTCARSEMEILSCDIQSTTLDRQDHQLVPWFGLVSDSFYSILVPTAQRWRRFAVHGCQQYPLGGLIIEKPHDPIVQSVP